MMLQLCAALASRCAVLWILLLQMPCSKPIWTLLSWVALYAAAQVHGCIGVCGSMSRISVHLLLLMIAPLARDKAAADQ
jgi:hypothetical protein